MIVRAKGAELHYTTRGRGPACVIPTAIGTRPYERQTARLAEHFTLVYVDPRGSGRSTGTASDLTFDVLAEDLEAVRGALGLERVAVLGHSVNGVLAFEYGRRCPATVSHVIAVGTPPFGDMATLMAKATPFFQANASDERKRILFENLAKLPPNSPPEETMFAQTPLRFFDPRFDARPLFAESEVKPEFMAHLLGPLVRGWDVTVGATELRTPILVALGRHDYVAPYTLWDDVKLPNATVQIFERSGHQPFCEEPERFAAVLTAWMG